MLLTSRVLGRGGPSLSRAVWTTSTQCSAQQQQPQQQQESRKIEENIIKKDDGVPAEVKSIQPPNKGDNFAPFRFVYPEFLPHPRLDWRNRIKEKLERIDMLRRRGNIEIPEFYPGSIMKVTVSDKNAPGKSNTFVGICTERGGVGLRAHFTLRNVVDGLGVEIMYEMYSPTIQSIVVLKLEKRLDENLRYLRDCAPEHSTFPYDMVPEIRNPDDPVPVNTMKVKLKSKPWQAKWHLWDLQGVEDFSDQLEWWQKKKMGTWKKINNIDHMKYDLMQIYRGTIPAEEQAEIYGEVHHKLASLTQVLRAQKRKRQFAKPQKTA